MSVAPHAGIVDFGTFTSPTSTVDGIQGEVPQPLAGQQDYVLTASGWVALSSLGTLVYQGTWDASTNTPTLVSSVGTQGYYYVVSVAGSTDLNGITTWTVGDWAVFNGSVWQKIEGGSTVDITGGQINNTTIGNVTPAAGTFTQVEIPTATTQSTLHENTTITGWIYSGSSFSISSQEGTPSGLFFSPDGLKMYVNGSAGDDVNEYTLSSAWNIATASYVTVFSTASQDSAPADLFFSPDGLTMFVIGDTNNTIYQYTLTTPWSVATTSYASKSFSVATQETSPSGLWFKPDGTTMYIVGSANDTVYQYTLGTAWDVSTASYASISFSVAAQEGTAVQVNLSSDGTKMWVLGSTGDDIWEYTLGTAWNVSTATPVNNFYVGFQDTAPSGLFIDSSAANRVFMVGSTSDTVYKYNTEANSLEIDTEKLYIDGQLSVNGNLIAGANAYVDGNLTVQNNINASGTASVGGLSSSGTTTLATGTGTQTAALAAGAVASGSTKTVNIGTAGVSGSTTTINIGSNVSGSLGTTTIQAPTVNIGQTATQFQVSNTASAVNYVQVTGAATGSRPQLSAQGSDTNIGLNLYSKGNRSVSLYTNNALAFEALTPSSGVNYFTANGSITGQVPSLVSSGTDTNIGLNLTTKGTGVVDVNTGNGTQFRVADTFAGGTATNYIQVQGRATFQPVLSTAGASTNIALQISTKGTGDFSVWTGGGAQQQFAVTHTASAVNYVQVTGAATGSFAQISAQGSDAITGLGITSKGAARINFFNNNGTNRQVSIGGNGAAAVNYLDLNGSATGIATSIGPAGTDTNIPLLLQTKGTGAIDLAAGSSGVNISNGGTVTAITRTATGSNYTSFPSISITAPTTAGGVQATASTATMFATGATVVAGGTGYTLNDVVTLSGGTPQTIGATYTVTGVSAGVVTAVTPLNYAVYTSLPTNPVSVTGGTGSGLTLTVVWNWNSATITNAGSGYVEQPTVTFSGGGGSGAAAYATVGSGVTVKSLGSTLSFYTPGGEGFRIVDNSQSNVNFWAARGSGTGASPSLTAYPTTAVAATVDNSQAASLNFRTNTNVTQLVVSHTASAVNYVQVTGGATGSYPVISAQGSDTNIILLYQSKGNQGHIFQTRGGGTPRNAFTIVDNGSASVNYLSAQANISGAAPILTSLGSDTNIDLTLTPKGTGTVVANGPFTATGQTSLGGAAGSEGLRVTTTASAVSYWKFSGSDISNAPSMTVESSNTNVGVWVFSKGTGAIRFGTNSAVTNEQLRVAHTASAVNYVQVTGAATGSAPNLQFTGSDANVLASFGTKGTGSFSFYSGGLTNRQVRIDGASAAVNYLDLYGAIASSAPSVRVGGSDTNIDLALTPKGTGYVQFGTYTGTALTIAGYIEIKDSGGTVRKLAVVA